MMIYDFEMAKQDEIKFTKIASLMPFATGRKKKKLMNNLFKMKWHIIKNKIYL